MTMWRVAVHLSRYRVTARLRGSNYDGARVCHWQTEESQGPKRGYEVGWPEAGIDKSMRNIFCQAVGNIGQLM